MRLQKKILEQSPGERQVPWRIYPLGDMHIGARACDEAKLRRVVQDIADDPRALWIGMGDYIDAINRSDPRFAVASLADWLITPRNLADIAAAQRDRAIEILSPIADKCLVMLSGNHETAVTKHYERDVYREIVSGIKAAAGHDPEYKLAMGYSGWLELLFREMEDGHRHKSSKVLISLHHGFVGGRLAGAKALNMQRWLWTHKCDIAIFGHSHNTAIQVEAVEEISGRRIVHSPRWGVYAGSFLDSHTQDGDTYSSVKGYLPQPTTSTVIELMPLSAVKSPIRVLTL